MIGFGITDNLATWTHHSTGAMVLEQFRVEGLETLMIFTLWLSKIAMENGPFTDDFPSTTSIYSGFSMVTSNNQKVNIFQGCA